MPVEKPDKIGILGANIYFIRIGWCTNSRLHIAMNISSHDGFSAVGKVSSAPSLKTCPRHVFLTLAVCPCWCLIDVKVIEGVSPL